MAYPLQCAGGYPVPLKAGRFEIWGYSAAPDVIGTATEVAIFDDVTIRPGDNFGRLISTFDENTKACLWYDKVPAGTSPGWQLAEPIKTRYGISIYTSNIKGGSLCLYAR